MAHTITLRDILRQLDDQDAAGAAYISEEPPSMQSMLQHLEGILCEIRALAPHEQDLSDGLRLVRDLIERVRLDAEHYCMVDLPPMGLEAPPEPEPSLCLGVEACSGPDGVSIQIHHENGSQFIHINRGDSALIKAL